MLERASSHRSLPGFVPLVLLFGVLAAGWLAAPGTLSLAAVAPPPIVNLDALNGSIGKLKAQQDLLVANQTKIEAQTALLKEEVRQAKIFAGRSR